MKRSKYITEYIEKICEEKKRPADFSSQGLPPCNLSVDSYWLYLEDIVSAMKEVGGDYYQLSQIDKGGKSSKKMYERMFAYEFYFQLRCIMKRNQSGAYHGLHLNGEPNKGMCTYTRLAGIMDKEENSSILPMWNKWNLFGKKYKESSHFIPDMVLHKPDGLEQQIYLLEIKLESNNDALGDLQKLTELKTTFEHFRQQQEPLANIINDPRFTFYIYVYVGDDFKSKLKNSQLSGTSRDIICIYGNSRINIECSALGELIDEL